MTISEDLAAFLQGTKTQYDAIINQLGDEDIDENESYYNIVKCPLCYRAYNIIHFECGNYIDVCDCGSTKEEVYYCNPCDTVWDLETGERIENFSSGNAITNYDDDYDAVFDDVDYPGYPTDTLGTKNALFDEDADDYSETLLKELGPGTTTTTTTTGTSYGYNTTGGTYTTGGTATWTKCAHKHVEMKLYDGTSIYCSSLRGVTSADDPVPDFGLYADYQWSPKWRNEFIHWPDFDIPTNEELGLEQICDAYIRATKGEMVEIGCIGGHGRTGTILAIMHLAAADGEVTPEQAIKYVKTQYCSSAIESDIQEWYIKFASHVWFGTELGEKPQKWASNYGGGCQLSDHSGMMLRGHTSCVDAGDKCKYWETDFKNFWKPKEKVTDFDLNTLKTAIKKAEMYDYQYGGLIRFENDPQISPCSPLEHYVMICLGHQECLRYGETCGFWVSDLLEWNEKGTIGNNSDWTSLSESAKELYDLYPSIEELQKDGPKVVPHMLPAIEPKPVKTTTTTTTTTTAPAKPETWNGANGWALP